MSEIQSTGVARDEDVRHPVGEETPGLFLRQSSGLVREIGLRDAFGIGAGILSPIGIFVVFAFALQLFPGTDMYIPVLVGAAASLLLAVTYAQLVTTLPRSGGEYIWASRIFTPFLGAMVGGAVLVALMLNCANSLIFESQIFIPFALTALAKAFSAPSIAELSSDISVRTPAFLTGLAMLLVMAWLGSRRVRTATKAIFVCLTLGIVAWLVIAALLLFNGHEAFVSGFNGASKSANAYQQVVASARQAGFSPGVVTSAVLAAIPFGYIVFIGFSFNNYAGGELKRPARTYLTATVAAVIVGVVGAVIAWASLRKTVGLDFMQAAGQLSATSPDRYDEISSVAPVQGGFAYSLILSGDPVTQVILAIGAPVGFFANAFGYFLLASRVVFALSFDRLLPAKMAEVREKTHSPIHAVALVFAGTLAFVALGDYTSVVTLFRNLTVVVVAIFFIGSLAAVVLPFRRKALYEGSPKIFAGRWLGVPRIAVIAGVTALVNALFVYLVATKPEISGGYSWDSVLTLVIVSTVGLVAYVVARLALRREGMDIDLAMRELPPE
jgi:amino acid transporter